MHLLDTLYHEFKSSAWSSSSGFLRDLVIGGGWLFVSRYLSFSLVFSRFCCQFCCTIFLLVFLITYMELFPMLSVLLAYNLFHHIQGAGGVLLQVAWGFLSGAVGRNQSETWEGCMVSCTTATRCSLSVARSTSLRRVALNASTVRAASYLRR